MSPRLHDAAGGFFLFVRPRGGRVDVAKLQRETYDTIVASSDAPFVIERPPLFSPAAAAQDEVNGKGGLHQWAAMFLPVEFTNWVEESRAHVESCYVGDWSALAKVTVSGPDAHAFLSQLGFADLSAFEPGQLKHHVQLDENGWVASEGVVGRVGDEEFFYTAGSCEWLVWRFEQDNWNAEVRDVTPDRFIIGVQGPTSLHTLEKATGGSLRDLPFSRFRTTQIGGIEMLILRTGISGELGYELHGPSGHANEIWRTLREQGEEFGIKQLGGRSQSVQHIEAGIATNGLDYMPASAITPGAPRLFRRRTVGGSFVPSAFTDFFRKPGELGWGRKDGAVPAHQFLGRDALLADADAGGPSRTLAGLIWNHDDVADVLSSVVGSGEIPDQMDLPRRLGPAFDQILANGDPAGISSGRTLSSNLRATISLAVLDRSVASPGTQTTVVWGRPGTSQRQIRATVVDLPFKTDRRRADVSRL